MKIEQWMFRSRLFYRIAQPVIAYIAWRTRCMGQTIIKSQHHHSHQTNIDPPITTAAYAFIQGYGDGFFFIQFPNYFANLPLHKNVILFNVTSNTTISITCHEWMRFRTYRKSKKTCTLSITHENAVHELLLCVSWTDAADLLKILHWLSLRKRVQNPSVCL